MVSLLSFGEVLIDFLPKDLDTASYTPLAGGAPANVAVGYAKLGGKSYFSGGVSTDNFGHMLIDQLNHHEVDTSYVNLVSKANTAIVVVSLDQTGEREFNFYRQNSADMHVDNSHIDNINWQNLGIFHYCSNTLTDQSIYQTTLYALDEARKNQVVISFDVNLRQQLWEDITVLPERVETCMNRSDIVKLSKDEALYLAHAKQLELQDYIKQLITFGVKLVVITDGANKAQVLHTNYSFYLDVPKIEAIDTTAAGDSFISGMLFYLAQHVSAHHCLYDVLANQRIVSSAAEFASKCGAYTCQHKGAFTALPKLNDILR